MRNVYKISAIVALFFLGSCSLKKNTAFTRQYEAFTTRYNVYHNGKEHYEEQLKEMEAKYEDDYTRRLFTHPAEARSNPKMPQPTGDFKRTIEKMQKSIQLHSIKKKPTKRTASQKEKDFRARTEFNPFLHNSWLTMAKSQYLNGDFSGAATTFTYISKNFTWLPEVVTEARIWTALSYAALDWVYEAENALHPVKESELTSSGLMDAYNRAKGEILMKNGQNAEAIAYFKKAAQSASGTQKNRLWFLIGQLYGEIGDKGGAYQAFANAERGISIPYRTKLNARIRQSEYYSGSDVAKEVKSLKSLLHYARNKEYADQIWYAIGNLYLAAKDTTDALNSYQMAVRESTRNGIDKALAQLALGNLYFIRHNYAKAQPPYAEGLPQIPDNFPGYRQLKLRGEVLDELASFSQNVTLQDSLLTLAAMPAAEQLKVAKRLAKEYSDKEKKEQEEKDLQEAEARKNNQPQADNNIRRNDAPAKTITNTGDKSWYFYNQMTKAQGKTEFQRLWGARKLEDNWRRRNKSSFAIEEGDGLAESSTRENPQQADSIPPGKGGDGASRDPQEKKGNASVDPHDPEYYLSQIPKGAEEVKNANDIIMEGLYNMALILKDKLEDYPAARVEFMTLERRYPDNPHRLDTYYNMYLMSVRENNKADAELWRRKIIADFPESPYGTAMRDPQYFENLRRMNQLQEEIYSNAYQAYLENRNTEVHGLAEKMEKDYPLSPLMPKFVFIDALSYLTEKDHDRFKERLGTLLEKWPDTDMTPMAAGIMKGIKSGKALNSGSGNATGMIWSASLSNDSTAVGEKSAARFTTDPDAPQYLVLAFPVDSVNVKQLIYDVARFNFTSFLVKDFDMEPMNFGQIGLLIIKGFPNQRELEEYRTVMSRNNLELPEGTRPIMISKSNFELLLREGRSFDEYFNFLASPPSPAGNEPEEPEQNVTTDE